MIGRRKRCPRKGCNLSLEDHELIEWVLWLRAMPDDPDLLGPAPSGG